MGDEPRVTLQMLRLLQPMLLEPTGEWYGLELAKRAGLKSGTIYPALARLENAGWLSSRWEVSAPGENWATCAG